MADSSKWKSVLDPVHGVIELDPLAVQIIDTREFQRLRFVKQLGCAEYVYPGATHTRFVHSIGVYHLTCKMIEGLKRWNHDPNIKMDDWEEECIRIAALCHDLGHGPFSHIYKEICQENPGQNWRWNHRDLSCLLVKRIFKTNESLRRQLKKGNASIRLIMRLIMGKKISDMSEDEKKKAYIYQIVSNEENSIDVDKWDYLCRDAMCCGMNERFFSERAILGARVVMTSRKDESQVHQIGYPEKDALMFYNMFQTRYTLHRYIYKHRVIIAMNLMIKDIFKTSDLEFKTKGCRVFNFELYPMVETSKVPDNDEDLDKFIDSFTDEEKKQTDKYIRLTDDIISRIRYINDKNGFSHGRPIANAIKTLDRIDSRDFYWMYREIHLKCGTKYKAAQEVKNECVQKLRQVDDMFSESAAVELISFNYGMREENPIDKMIFYNKRDPVSGDFKGNTITKRKVSHLLTDVFSDYYIRIYVKERDYAETIKTTVKELAQMYDTESEQEEIWKPLGEETASSDRSSVSFEHEEIRAVDVMLAALSDQDPPQVLEAKTKSLIQKYRSVAREADWLRSLEDTLDKSLTSEELRPRIFVIIFKAHISDLEDFLKTCHNSNHILEISIRYVLKVGDMQIKTTILNIAAREFQAKVGKKYYYVWGGMDYRDEKQGESSLVCFYTRDLQDQPKVFLGLPVLYKEWNTIEKEPLQHCLSEEYRHTNFLQKEKDIKRVLLHNQIEVLFKQHSNLEAVSASSVLSSKTRGLVTTPSIVLYCRFKGVIPIGEDTFPKELRVSDIVLPTDVREGFFTLGMMNAPILRPTDFQPQLKMGCSIGRQDVKLAGTLGPFVKDDEGNVGFLTCAHLVGIDPQTTINQYVVQPADIDSTHVPRDHNRVCGQIRNAIFDDQRPIGIDAALVMVDTSIRDIDPINFVWNDSTQLEFAGFDLDQPPSFLGGAVQTEITFRVDDAKRIIKCGRSTGLKRGSIALDGASIRIRDSALRFHDGFPWMSNENVVMRGQYIVECSGTPFFDLGDSGAGVYLVERGGRTLSLIGLAIGLLSESYCVVTPIKAVLEALGLRPDNVISSEHMDAM